MKSKTLFFSKLFPRTSETLAEKQPSSPPILINLYQSNLQNNHTSDEDSQHSSFVQASLEPLVKWTDFQEETRMRLVLLVLFNSFAAHLLRLLTTHPRLLNLYSSDSRNLLLCKDRLNWSGTELLSRTGSKVAGSAFSDYQDLPSCPKDGLGFLVSNWIPLSAEGWVPWNSLWICVRRFGSLPSSNQRCILSLPPLFFVLLLIYDIVYLSALLEWLNLIYYPPKFIFPKSAFVNWCLVGFYHLAFVLNLALPVSNQMGKGKQSMKEFLCSTTGHSRSSDVVEKVNHEPFMVETTEVTPHHVTAYVTQNNSETHSLHSHTKNDIDMELCLSKLSGVRQNILKLKETSILGYIIGEPYDFSKLMSKLKETPFEFMFDSVIVNHEMLSELQNTHDNLNNRKWKYGVDFIVNKPVSSKNLKKRQGMSFEQLNKKIGWIVARLYPLNNCDLCTILNNEIVHVDTWEIKLILAFHQVWITYLHFQPCSYREDMQIKPDIRILWLEGLSFMDFLLYIILRTCNKYVQDANMHIRRLDAEMELHSVEIEAGHISYITSHNSLYKTMFLQVFPVLLHLSSQEFR